MKDVFSTGSLEIFRDLFINFRQRILQGKKEKNIYIFTTLATCLDVDNHDYRTLHVFDLVQYSVIVTVHDKMKNTSHIKQKYISYIY